MILNKINFYLALILFVAKINVGFSVEIKTLVIVDNKIITTEDLEKEKIILGYLFENKIDKNNLNTIALENLIDENIKSSEVKKKNMLISDEETMRYLEIILKNYGKSLKDFREKISNNTHQNFLKNKVQNEMSWNKLISFMYSNLININLDEIISKTNTIDTNSKEFNNIILIEKKKKLQSLSESYFNEVKNKTLIKYQ